MTSSDIPSIKRKYILSNPKGNTCVKYLALGDSLTYGEGASNYQGTFPYVIGQKLLKHYKQVEVINLAECGARVEDLISKQLPRAVKEKPDLVTIMIGTNDVHRFTGSTGFKKSLENIVTKLQTATTGQILLINIPYLVSEFMAFPLYQKLISARIKRFNQVISEVADSMGVADFDLYTKTKDYFQKGSDLYSSDQFHPSDKGYHLWGRLIGVKKVR